MSRTGTDEEAIPVPEVGQTLGNGYRVERVIAIGGMGVVLEASQPALGRSVALKLLKKSGEQRAARLVREARAAAAIQSEHVARVYEVGQLEDGQPFIAMELLRGRTLADHLEHEGRLRLDAAVDIVLEAAIAVAEAHERGIVHRDLKPSNLFLANRPGSAPIVKVLDFGISKVEALEEPAMTETGTQLGTPVYMAPEQVRESRNADARSDIWALGVVLHELVVGKRPFEAESLPGLGAAIVTDSPRNMRDARPELDSGFEAVVLRCLEKDAVSRYQSVADLARALEPFASPSGKAHAERIHELVRTDLCRDEPGDGSIDAPTATTGSKRDVETLDATSTPASGKHTTGLVGLVAVSAVGVALWVWWPTPTSPSPSFAPSTAPARPAAATIPELDQETPKEADDANDTGEAAPPVDAATITSAKPRSQPRGPRAPIPTRAKDGRELDPFEHRK